VASLSRTKSGPHMFRGVRNRACLLSFPIIFPFLPEAIPADIASSLPRENSFCRNGGLGPSRPIEQHGRKPPAIRAETPLVTCPHSLPGPAIRIGVPISACDQHARRSSSRAGGVAARRAGAAARCGVFCRFFFSARYSPDA